MSLIEKYKRNEITFKKLDLLENLIKEIKILISKIIDKKYDFVDISFKHLRGLSYCLSVKDKLSKNLLNDILIVKISFKNMLSLNEREDEIIDLILTDASDNTLKLKEFRVYIEDDKANQKVKSKIAFLVKEQLEKLTKE